MAVPVPGKIKCPSCGYALLGLPVAHACPECGVEYDPHSVLVRLTGRSRVAVNASNGLCLLVMLSFPFLVGKLPDQHFREMIPCIVVVALFTFVALYLWARCSGQDRLLIISRAGIRFKHPDMPGEIIPWLQFGRAQAGYIEDSFKIRDSDGRVVFKCRLSRFGAMRQARYCAAQMNRLAKVYAAEGGSIP